jgi:hypothetical protein
MYPCRTCRDELGEAFGSMVLDGGAQGWRGIPGAPPASASQTAAHASLRPCPSRRWGDQSTSRHWATATLQSGQEKDEGLPAQYDWAWAAE